MLSRLWLNTGPRAGLHAGFGTGLCPGLKLCAHPEFEKPRSAQARVPDHHGSGASRPGFRQGHSFARAIFSGETERPKGVQAHRVKGQGGTNA